ncbi:MAG: PstS family phosphate ABC transporter substrate-binding protein [Candidatus Eisenbacteria bacterium]
MKKIGITLLAACLIAGMAAQAVGADSKPYELKGRITFSGAWALYPMAVRWAEEFQKIHPDVKMDIGAGGAGKGMADCLAGVVDIGMVSRQIYPEEVKKGAWWVSVTKDAVVPTVNDANPVLKDLLARGVTREACIGIWTTGEIKTWGDLTGRPLSSPIQVYTRSDACGAAGTWAQYMDRGQEDLLGIGVYGDPGLAQAVRQDQLGIGYNNINYAYDAKTKAQIQGIRVLPIDTDGNGKIDEEEDFYLTRDGIVKAIATGKYPSPPARDLHFVCKGNPENEVVREFIRWVLTDGQKYVHESGYINLTEEKLLEEIKHLQGE